MILLEQRWLACTMLLCAVIVPAGQVPAQDTPAQAPAPAPDTVADIPEPASVSTALTQPHLASDKIADVFRAQTQTPAVAQQPRSEAAPDGVPSAGAKATPDEISQWVDQLGRAEFAAREQATAKLRAVGKQAMPVLQKAAQEHADLEVRMRAGTVADGIAGNETAGRVDAFLAGKDVSMEGWNVARKILGDGIRVRELYVEIFLRHEAAAAALEGSTKQRAEAFRATIIDIQRGMFVEHRLTTEADVIALLLLANDQDMPISRVEEGAMFTTMRREATSRLLIDAQLSGLFRALLGGWVTRSDVSNRQDMLWFAMNCNLDQSLQLALETLQKSTDPPTLAMAMQAISRFGDKSNISDVAQYLDDERAASEVQYFGGNVIEPQLRDAAMAAIVLLSDRQLADYHLDPNAIHANFGFIVQAIGFPAENNELRLEAIEKVKRELVPAK